MSDDYDDQQGEPLPSDWPTEPLPEAPVVWDKRLLADYLRHEFESRWPEHLDDLLAGRLSFETEPFDDRGTTTLTLRKLTGEELPIAVEVHWSALQRRDQGT
jgi:hypothetical protein